jgi:uncharacterized membrane protein HdeD (DUF308 family)
VAHGDTASFIVTPETGHLVQSVTGCDGALVGSTFTTGPVTSACTVTATFIPKTYTVSTEVVGSGSISPTSRTVAHGDSTTFTLTPDTGYSVQSVTGCSGTLVGSTFTTAAVTSDCTVTATFIRNTYTVSTQVVGSGSISLTSTTVAHGDSTTFTVTPDTGHQVQSVTGCDGALVGNTYTTGPVTSACTVTATFIPKTYTVSTVVVGSGSISPTSRTVAHGDSTSFTLTPDTGHSVQSVTGCGGTLVGSTFTTAAVTSDCTVTATFILNTYTVSTQVVGAGSISPTSTTVAHGDTASFIVTPETGHLVQSVTGCDGALVGSTFTTGPVTSACTVTATFIPKTYTVSTVVVGSGSISPTSRTVAHGDTTSFTLTPDTGYSVQSVTGCGGTLVGSTFTTAAVTSDCTVTATFILNTYTVSTVVVGSGSISPTSRTVAHDDTASFTVTPDTGHQVQSVTGCDGALVGSTFTTGPVTSACTVTATFIPKTYTVSTEVVGSGSISPTNRTVAHGDNTSFTVTPDTGHSVQSVTGCGGTLVGSTFTTAAVTSDCTVTATFILNTYTVSTVVVGSGSISPTSATVAHGDSTSFTVTPDTGHLVQSVTGCDGTLVGSTFTTGPVTSACTVTATFIPKTYTVSTVVASGQGSISPTSRTVAHGDTTSFTVTPETGYSVQSVTGCGGALVGNTFTTAAVTSDCTVTVSFILNTYTVSTQVAAGQGSFSPTSATVAHGDTTSFTVTPASGYWVRSVTGCGGTLVGSTFTTAAVTSDCTVTASFGRLPHSLRLTVRDPVVNACGESVLDLQLVDADGNPVAADPSAPVTVNLAVAAPAGTPRIVNVGLEEAVRQGTSSVTGRMPAAGASTLSVSLDAAELLTVAWSSTGLPGSPPSGPAAQVRFQVGPVDASTSSVTVSGTQVFAGSGSVAVTVIPRDACGLDLGPGQTVDLETSHGTLTDVQDNGDGTYTANLSAEAGQCPPDPAHIIATVNTVVLDDQPEVSILCAALDPDSLVTLLPDAENTRACARQGEFARVRVIPRDTQGAPLPPGQAVTLVEHPPYVVSGGVEMAIDQDTGAPVYTVLVGSNRCSPGAPYPIEVRVANIPLTTRPSIDFKCPPIPEGGVSFVATPAIVPADGATVSQVRVSVVDACGNPGFGRSLDLRSHGETSVVLSAETATTADALGAPEDGTVLLEVRSEQAGVTGVDAWVDGTWHQSDGSLITFVAPENPGFYLGGNGLGCATAGATTSGSGGAVGGLLWLGILLVLRRRKVTQ